jgi:hypothetical protein
MTEKETLNIAGHDVIIDPANLDFNETTLNRYIQTEGGYYDNFGSFLALAEKTQHMREMEYESIYNERIVEAKENGATDKISEAKAKSNIDVLDAKKLLIEAKYKVKRLMQHLRAWDKNHDNAQSLGHMLRKEMDKLNSEIMGRANMDSHQYKIDQRIEDTIASIDEQESGMSELDMNDLKSLIG